MLKKFMRRSRKLLVKTKDTLKVIIAAILIATQTLPLPVYAAGQGYLVPLTNLKTIFIAIVAAAGVIVLGYGGVKFAVSFQKMDQNGEHQAIYTVIAGAVMLGISGIMAALGA